MFRNLTMFRFSQAFSDTIADVAEFQDALEAAPMRDCGPLESFTRGFVSPYGLGNDALVLGIEKATLFTIGQQEKLLPAAILNAAVAQRMREEQAAGRHVGPRARKRLKAELLDQMLPRAFVRPSRLDGYVDTLNGWLVLDTASPKVAEVALTQLRHALGSFPALPLAPDMPPRLFMTEWLAQDSLPPDLEFGDECELRDPAGGAIAKCSRQQMENREVKEHLRSGKQVFRLGLVYRDRLSFVLDESLVIRKLRFLDLVMERMEDCEDAASELRARTALMVGELRALLATLAAIFGVQRPEN